MIYIVTLSLMSNAYVTELVNHTYTAYTQCFFSDSSLPTTKRAKICLYKKKSSN